MQLHSLVEKRSVMPAVALSGEVNTIGRVLRESARETLQRLPHTRRSALGCVCGVGNVRRGVCTTSTHIQGILWASCIWQSDDVACVGIHVARYGVGVAEANLRWVVDEEHVRHVAASLISTVAF
jgi:hypothetical protein